MYATASLDYLTITTVGMWATTRTVQQQHHHKLTFWYNSSCTYPTWIRQHRFACECRNWCWEMHTLQPNASTELIKAGYVRQYCCPSTVEPMSFHRDEMKLPSIFETQHRRASVSVIWSPFVGRDLQVDKKHQNLHRQVLCRVSMASLFHHIWYVAALCKFLDHWSLC